MNTDSTIRTAEGAMRQTAESVSQLAEKVQETVRQTQARLNDLQKDLVGRTKVAAESTDAYVHENPWNAVGAAFGVGFILGIILGRR